MKLRIQANPITAIRFPSEHPNLMVYLTYFFIICLNPHRQTLLGNAFNYGSLVILDYVNKRTLYHLHRKNKSVWTCEWPSSGQMLSLGISGGALLMDKQTHFTTFLPTKKSDVFAQQFDFKVPSTLHDCSIDREISYLTVPGMEKSGCLTYGSQSRLNRVLISRTNLRFLASSFCVMRIT